jgi:hypothetical protein
VTLATLLFSRKDTVFSTEFMPRCFLNSSAGDRDIPLTWNSEAGGRHFFIEIREGFLVYYVYGKYRRAGCAVKHSILGCGSIGLIGMMSA